MHPYILVAMEILPWTVPTIAGLLSATFINEKNRELLTGIYYIMLALSVIPLLFGLLYFLFVMLNNLDHFAGLFLLVASITALAVQAALMIRFFARTKVRMVLRLTLMATPIFVFILTLLIFGAFDIDIYLAM